MEPHRPFPVVASVIAGLAIVAASLALVVSDNRAEGSRLATVDRSPELQSSAVDEPGSDLDGSAPDLLAFNEVAGSGPDGPASEAGSSSGPSQSVGSLSVGPPPTEPQPTEPQATEPQATGTQPAEPQSGEVASVEVWPRQWVAITDSVLAQYALSTSTSTTSSSTTAPPPPASTTTTMAQPTTQAPPSPTEAAPPPTTAQPTTQPPATQPPAEPAPQPQPTKSGGGGGANAGLEALRNTGGSFGRFASVPNAQLDLGALTESAHRKDNGSVGDGQFRVACQYSHFAYDDPIVFPGEPGRSHLHMFFGNTAVNAHTTTDSLLNSGGGTCNGFELNRSGYWIPALLDGRGNAVVPEKIIIYYKTTRPGQVQPLPQDLKIIAGNPDRDSFEASSELFWSCGKNGHAYNKTNRIPDCGGDVINASIVFPQCWDGRNFDSANHRAHMASVNTEVDCPGSHPIRFPQISILVYWPGQSSVDGWHLSSDRSGGFNSGPGATLHADWWGGWNDDAMNLWINGCMKAARNCSFGQTGTDRSLARINDLQNYPGPYTLPLP